MGTALDRIISGLPAKRRSGIQRRAKQLIAEEMSLRDLRRSLEMTQERIAELLHIGQDSISRLENRNDVMLSTLAAYIKALGGSLHLVAEFPGRSPVSLSGIVNERIKQSEIAAAKRRK